jgi:RsmE family RNA methyltransferase
MKDLLYLNLIMFAFAITFRCRFSTAFTQQVQNPKSHSFFRKFHQTAALNLNRFLFDPSEVDSQPKSFTDPIITITLTKNDYRTVHAAKVLGLHNGDSLRAGIVQDANINNSTSRPSIVGEESDYSGLITDDATIEWLPEGKIKKAQPTKNGDPPGSLKITLHGLTPIADEISNIKPRISLILALPRPLALGRLLPMIAQMGVEDLILTQAAKVPKDYFGSHLFRKPMEIRKALIEGLCQAADVRIPTVTVVKRLKPFIEDDLENMFPKERFARVIAHPQRKDGEPSLRMSQISFPEGISGDQKRIVLAVGPEGGWSEPYELDMFRDHGFQQVTLGSRILRSDVAVVSLLSLAADICSTEE